MPKSFSYNTATYWILPADPVGRTPWSATGPLAGLLVRAVSRLIATPAPISGTVWMPSVARSGDAARTSAYATVAAAKLCEICGLVDEKSGLVSTSQRRKGTEFAPLVSEGPVGPPILAASQLPGWLLFSLEPGSLHRDARRKPARKLACRQDWRPHGTWQFRAFSTWRCT